MMNKVKVILLTICLLTILAACGKADEKQDTNVGKGNGTSVQYDEVLTDRNGVEVIGYNVPEGFTKEDYPVAFGVQLVKPIDEYDSERFQMYVNEILICEDIYNAEEKYEWKIDDMLTQTYYKKGEIETPYGVCKIFFDDAVEDYVSDFQVGLLKVENKYVFIEWPMAPTSSVSEEDYNYFVDMLNVILGVEQGETEKSND